MLLLLKSKPRCLMSYAGRGSVSRPRPPGIYAAGHSLQAIVLSLPFVSGQGVFVRRAMNAPFSSKRTIAAIAVETVARIRRDTQALPGVQQNKTRKGALQGLRGCHLLQPLQLQEFARMSNSSETLYLAAIPESVSPFATICSIFSRSSPDLRMLKTSLPAIPSTLNLWAF